MRVKPRGNMRMKKQPLRQPRNPTNKTRAKKIFGSNAAKSARYRKM